jgi:phenylpyruvate tautomerase PptA (4-oxalocrotonate tautomerase family)
VKSVAIYVEGKSDQSALTELLRPLIEKKQQDGVAIQFFEAPSGDRKESLMVKVPKRAAKILKNDPSAIVIAVPDLYPLNKGEAHTTPGELFTIMRREYEREAAKMGIGHDPRLWGTF